MSETYSGHSEEDIEKNNSPECLLTPKEIEEGFEKLGEEHKWVTEFEINGCKYGGDKLLDKDPRVAEFFETFSSAKKILDLGSFEGGQTFGLARHQGTDITAVESRDYNIKKAEFIQKIRGVNNIKFLQANLEDTPLSNFGKFDAIFLSGLLYHLPKPWKLIDQLSKVAPSVFIWTHYSKKDKITDTINGIPGHWFKEQGFKDPLSGMSDRSFWMTLPSITERLKNSGYNQVDVLREEDHENGPVAIIAAWKGKNK